MDTRNQVHTYRGIFHDLSMGTPKDHETGQGLGHSP
ncbi:DNA 3'-5' helicase OS=Streptomyces griseomycini OX=66895 GN=FHS37_006622 PE=4 SV=1 [Streptomyces griseomycini]